MTAAAGLVVTAAAGLVVTAAAGLVVTAAAGLVDEGSAAEVDSSAEAAEIVGHSVLYCQGPDESVVNWSAPSASWVTSTGSCVWVTITMTGLDATNERNPIKERKRFIL